MTTVLAVWVHGKEAENQWAVPELSIQTYARRCGAEVVLHTHAPPDPSFPMSGKVEALRRTFDNPAVSTALMTDVDVLFGPEAQNLFKATPPGCFAMRAETEAMRQACFGGLEKVAKASGWFMPDLDRVPAWNAGLALLRRHHVEIADLTHWPPNTPKHHTAEQDLLRLRLWGLQLPYRNIPPADCGVWSCDGEAVLKTLRTIVHFAGADDRSERMRKALAAWH